ncbi:hypothetical protein [Streptomyces sp. NPDC046978]|uniref:hypothetical protein n=1 Tax=unclassified Streptomyces TaxID=2593676 RepID=UPI003407E789
MPDTFGGEWRRPRSDGRGHSQRELQDRASYDNQPANDCSSALFLLTVLTTSVVAAIRQARK